MVFRTRRSSAPMLEPETIGDPLLQRERFTERREAILVRPQDIRPYNSIEAFELVSFELWIQVV